MVHPDHETRVGAHRIFSVVLVPFSVCPRPCPITPELKKASDLPRMLSRTVSVFSSSAALFEKLRKEKYFSKENICQENKEDELKNNNAGILNRMKSSLSRAYSLKSSAMSLTTDANFTSNSNNELVGSGKFYASIESLSVVGMALYESGPATITAPY